MNLLESLQNIGLNEKEAKVYLALLQLGKTTAYSVSLRSGIKKPTTYVILEQLVKKGYAFEIPRARKHIFFAESPDKCFAMAREKLVLAQESLPELMAARKGESEKVNISYFEGLEGIKEMYDKFFEFMKKKPAEERFCSGFYAHARDVSKDVDDFWKEYNAQVVALDIKRRGMTPKDETLKWYFENAKNLNIDLIGLPKEIYDSNVSFEIFDKFVQIISYGYLQGTLIENRDVANSFRQIFEIIWNVYKNENNNGLKTSPQPSPMLPSLRPASCESQNTSLRTGEDVKEEV